MSDFLKSVRREIWQIYDNLYFEIIQFRIAKETKLRRRRQARVNVNQTVSDPPNSANFKNRVSWYCGNCDKYNEIFLDKFAALISSEKAKIKFSCAFCTSNDCQNQCSLCHAEIDDEVLEFWMEDEDAYFWPQDEDLFLAMLPLDVLVSMLRRSSVEGLGKGFSLVEALLVKFSDGEYKEDERDMLTSWLEDNRKVWDQSPIWEYLREDVREKLKKVL